MSLPANPALYESLLHQAFVVEHPDTAPLELKLTRVVRTIDDEIQLCFTLVFEGPADLLPQGLYRLKHPQLEVEGLLLVPSARTKAGFRYSATFNLLKEH